MPYTSIQQDKIDKAQGRLNNAKSSYSVNVTRYNDWVASIQPCYKDTIQDATAASSWYNPTKPPCEAKGSCDISNCKNTVDKLNGDIIPTLRAAYNEQVAAQSNFDKVLSEVAQESKNDPANQAAHDAAVASASEAEKASQKKWIFWTVFVVVVGFLIFAYFRWFRKVVKVG